MTRLASSTNKVTSWFKLIHMVKKYVYSVSVELCSELTKKPKNKHAITKFFIICLHIFETLSWSTEVVVRKRDHGCFTFIRH